MLPFLLRALLFLLLVLLVALARLSVSTCVQSLVGDSWWRGKWSTARGFETLRAEPNGFRVHLLDRSDTVSCMAQQDGEALLQPSARVEVFV